MISFRFTYMCHCFLGFSKNFDKLPTDETDLLEQDYDVMSTMHYDSYTYAINKGQLALRLRKDGSPVLPAFSIDAQDIEKVKLLYDCRGNSMFFFGYMVGLNRFI